MICDGSVTFHRLTVFHSDTSTVRVYVCVVNCQHLAVVGVTKLSGNLELQRIKNLSGKKGKSRKCQGNLECLENCASCTSLLGPNSCSREAAMKSVRYFNNLYYCHIKL